MGYSDVPGLEGELAMNRSRNILMACIAMIIGITFSFILIEGVLWFFPVNESLRTSAVNDANPVIRSDPNRTITWSKFPDFSMVNTVRINNYGFTNNQDYSAEANSPLIAVIGDSYVEALMVPYEYTGFGRMDKYLGENARVYSFGRSGAPLSQYLAYAKWVKENFNPKKMIFVIIGNDFDESLLKYKSAGGLHYFKENGENLELIRVDYEPNRLARFITHSKIAMYLLTNIQIQNHLKRLFTRFSATEADTFVGQTSASTAPQRLTDSKKAVDTFFKLLPEATGLPPKDICLVVDGIRPNLYDPSELAKTTDSYFSVLREYFIDQAGKDEYSTIDMQPIFIENHKTQGQKFEFEKDGHWNSHGHDMFFQAVKNSGFLNNFDNSKQ